MTSQFDSTEIQAEVEADLDATERKLRAHLASNPGSFADHLSLARVCFRRNDFAATREAVQEALKLDPDHADATALLGRTAYYLGEMDTAIECYRSVSRTRRSATDYLNLGVFLHQAGRLPAAIEALRRSLEISADAKTNDIVMAKFGLMRCYRDLGDHEEADRAAQAVRFLFKKQPINVSSRILNYFNCRDGHGWDMFRAKDKFARNVAAYLATTKADYPRIPASYVLPDEAEKLSADASAGDSNSLWIVKPNDLFGGQGIRVVDTLDKMPKTGRHVVQEYVSNPLLLMGRKAHLRLYILAVSIAPLRAYFWQDGIVRIAPEPFAKKEGWLDHAAIHITNTALHSGHPDLQFSDDPTVENFGNVWSLRAYLDEIAQAPEEKALVLDRLRFTAHGFLKIVEAAGLFAEGQQNGSGAYAPKLIGMDVLLDDQLQPWLLEMQRHPGQTGPGPVNHINGRLYRTIMEMTTVPHEMRLKNGQMATNQDLERSKKGDFIEIMRINRTGH